MNAKGIIVLLLWILTYLPLLGTEYTENSNFYIWLFGMLIGVIFIIGVNIRDVAETKKK